MITVTLAEALRHDRLADFIEQEEARGIGPIARSDFDALTATLVKAPQSKGRTSRSASAGNSSETKIPPDSDQGASR